MCNCWFKKIFGGKCNCECKCCKKEEKSSVNTAPMSTEAKPAAPQSENVEKTQ